MTAPTVRHRQQINAGVLSNLLTHDLPVATWTIYPTDGRADGLVGGVDDVRAWAQVIAGGAARVQVYRNGSGSFRASGIGAYAQVEVWCPLAAEEVAELNQPAAELLTVEGVS